MASKRLRATTWSLDQISRAIDQLVGGMPAEGQQRGEAQRKGRFSELYRLIRVREEHYFNRPEADPVLPEPYSDSPLRYQTDALRQTHVELKARIAENPWRVQVTPDKERAKQQERAQALETILQRGIEQAEERAGIGIQEDLADGQGIACYGVLHWRKADDLWPVMPDADETDDEPEDAKRYRKRDDDEDGPRYVETPESLAERDREAKARAGFPFDVEVIHPALVAWIKDRKGLAAVLVMRNVPIIEYRDELQKDGLKLRRVSVNQYASRVQVYEEGEQPSGTDPSADTDAWGRNLRVAQWWTRDEFYELCAEDSGKWTLVKSGPHPYERPPFAIAAAQHTNHPDPALAYEPALVGMYRIKPFVDFDVTMGRIIAGNIAMPLYWIKLADGAMVLDEAGRPIVLSRNSLAAQVLPEGATLEKVDFDLNPAFLAFLEAGRDDLEEAKPGTGNAEITASTQPWTARLGQAQANIEPIQYVTRQAEAIRDMARNMALVMSKTADDGGFGQAIGVLDGTEVVSIEPEEIANLQIDVEISPVTRVEQITATEHGAMLQERGIITRRRLHEDYMQDEDPQAAIDEADAEEFFEAFFKPQVMRQIAAEKFRGYVAVDAQGGFVGADGAALTPEQVLQQQGVEMTDPVAASAGQQGAVPGLPGLAAPGVDPLGGLS